MRIVTAAPGSRPCEPLGERLRDRRGAVRGVRVDGGQRAAHRAADAEHDLLLGVALLVDRGERACDRGTSLASPVAVLPW